MAERCICNKDYSRILDSKGFRHYGNGGWIKQLNRTWAVDVHVNPNGQGGTLYRFYGPQPAPEGTTTVHQFSDVASLSSILATL